MNHIIYEYPLSERHRLLLRLDQMFDQFGQGHAGDSPWSSWLAVTALLALLDLATHSEPRAEVSRELERQAQIFTALQQRPDIDHDALERVLDDIDQALDAVRTSPLHSLDGLRQNQFLNGVRQRMEVTGGGCPLELPALRHWLHRTPAEDRGHHLAAWLDPLQPLQRGARLALDLLRGSVFPQPCVASNGRYQQVFDDDPRPLMLRLQVAADQDVYPEIDGNRHRFSVRFMHQPEPEQGPQAVTQDVPFQLACCVI